VILVVEPDIEPDRRVEGPILVQAQPRHLIIKNLALGPGKITVLDPPIRDSAADAVDELAHRSFPFRGALFAIEILRDDHRGRQQGPRLGHLDILLPENHLAAVVGDFRRPPLPLNLVERADLGIAEPPLDFERFPRRGLRALFGSAGSRHRCGPAASRRTRLGQTLFVGNYHLFPSALPVASAEPPQQSTRRLGSNSSIRQAIQLRLATLCLPY